MGIYRLLMECFHFPKIFDAVAEAAGLFAEAASAQERVRLALEAQDRGASRVGWIAPRSLPAIWQVSFCQISFPSFFGNWEVEVRTSLGQLWTVVHKLWTVPVCRICLICPWKMSPLSAFRQSVRAGEGSQGGCSSSAGCRGASGSSLGSPCLVNTKRAGNWATRWSKMAEVVNHPISSSHPQNNGHERSWMVLMNHTVFASSDVCQHEAKATNSYQLPWTLGSTCYHRDGHQSLLIYLVALWQLKWWILQSCTSTRNII